MSDHDLTLVTGGNGFIGSHVMPVLRASGRKLRALVRRPADAARHQAFGEEAVLGDLLDPQANRHAVAGVGSIIHLAHGADETAARATASLASAAAAAGVRRFVHVSSTAVHGLVPLAEDGDERTARIPPSEDSYCRSKAEEEMRVRDAATAGGFELVVLRPAIVYGPGSPFVTQVRQDAVAGLVTLINGGRGTCNAVYVGDVCTALLRALDAPAARVNGNAYFITADTPVTWADFIMAFATDVEPSPVVRDITVEQALEEAARWHARRRAPRPIRTLRHLWERVTPGTPRPLPMSEGRVARETVGVTFSNRLAGEDLSWQPETAFQEGVARTLEWLRSAAGAPSTA